VSGVVAEPDDLAFVGLGIRIAAFWKGTPLSTVRSRNLKYEIDFRSVYQTLIRDWLHGDAATVLGATYPELPP
jgi:hypothetical protein